MRMAVINIRFEPYNKEDIEQYFKILEMFLLTNEVADNKQVGHVLSYIVAKVYSVLKKLVNHYKPKPPVIGQRFVFYQRQQKSVETVNDFKMELRSLARMYVYVWIWKFFDQALHNCFVCGLSNTSIQRKLLSEQDLTLHGATEMVATAEMTM